MRLTAAILCVLALPGILSAGLVFGTIRTAGAPVGEGSRIEVTCPNGPGGEGETQDRGSYRVRIRSDGKCSLRVYHNNAWTRKTSIYSYGKPTRYDFDIVETSAGYELREN